MLKRPVFLAFIFVVLMMGLVTGITTVSEASPIAVWLFDEDTGNILKDYSSNGNNGKITGGEWIDGKFGKALKFDENTFVEVESHKEGVFTPSEITIMLWANIAAINNGLCCVGIPRLGIYLDPTKASWSFEGSITSSPQGTYLASFWANVDTNWQDVHSTTMCKFSEWYHVAATYDGNDMKFYVNGVLENTVNMPGKIVPSDGPIRFSHDWQEGGVDRSFLGAIDECLIADKALSEGDIKNAMETGLNTFAAITPGGKLAVSWGSIKTSY